MSEAKRDFYGKDVARAIEEAVAALKVPQEQLEIEVLETGSSGIFGLIRKKARIRVQIKATEVKGTGILAEESQVQSEKETAPAHEDGILAQTVTADSNAEKAKETSRFEGESVEDDSSESEVSEASSETLGVVHKELTELLRLMGYVSEVDVQCSGLHISCTISDEYQEQLAGYEGKVLDAIQYLLRKVVARKCPERLRIAVNVGNFREQRLEDLKEKARDFAEQVKKDGRTQVLPALNPSERREIHMVLQEDKEVRSRSVGDGLFKKILIYKPGKTVRNGGGGNGSRKGGGRGGRRGRPQQARQKKSGE